MKRILFLCSTLIASCLLVQAQDDYHKLEFFGGYSLLNFDNASDDASNPEVSLILGRKQRMQGLNAAITYNFRKYWGAKFDYSLHLREDNFVRPLASGTTDRSVQNFLFGIQVKNNLVDGPRLKPFGHGLMGVGHQKIDIDSPQLPLILGVNDFSIKETSVAWAFGGGVDLKINDRFDARLGQVDWNIIKRGGQQIIGITPGQTISVPSEVQNNLRFSVGIVIH